jgi:hypothetical protein
LLVSARQKNDDRSASPREVHAVSLTDIDSHLGHALSDRRDVSRMTRRKTFDTRLNPRSVAEVAQTVEPARKALSLAQLGHCATVSRWLHRVNGQQAEGEEWRAT